VATLLKRILFALVALIGKTGRSSARDTYWRPKHPPSKSDEPI
jgi:hypothetical protein